MRRKQLYAIILAGALAAGGTPISALAADPTQETAESGDEAGDLGTGDAADAPQEEAPTEAPAEEPTEAPAEVPTEAPAEEPTETPAAEPTETPTEETTGIAITTGDTTAYFKTLQEAVDAAAAYSADNTDPVIIQVLEPVSLSSTVQVSGKNICIYAAGDEVSITREAGFTGDMFNVTGQNSTLYLAAADGKSLTVSGKLDDGQTADGSIVNVTDGGEFGIGANVTLTENISTADGGAVICKGGNLALAGGVITGNTGARGAVYSDSNICVQGSVKVTDNNAGEAQANVYLDGEAQFAITGAIADSQIFFTHANAAEGTQVLAAAEGIDAETFKNAAAQFNYDTEEYSLNLDETTMTATLKTAGTPTVSPEPSAVPSQMPTETPAATPTPTKTPSFLTYKSGTLKWNNHTTVSLKMSVTKDCKWYYFYVDAGTSTSTIQNMYDASRATNEVKANNEFTVTAENVPEADTWLVVCAKPTSGKAQMRVFKLDSASFKKKRPSLNPSETTRPARTHKVTESTVSGLENPLKFTPGTFYEFTVTGAGQNDKSPYVSGDERWIPMYWSTEENPTSSQKNTTFRIGSGKGIKEAKTYNMYIFFKKQIYNGSEWQDTDVIESITTQFRSQELTDADLTVTPSGAADGGNGGGSGSNGGDASTEAELTATEAASEKGNGSSSKSAVSTMDESPIGTMAALAAFSVLAGGYILIRKRKKDTE
ncbi:MAG: hypothetical protein Q4Q33_03450 [Eubacteriales bacterium]|nr:hypothetical protein [Eubacteriales bacterium]